MASESPGAARAASVFPVSAPQARDLVTLRSTRRMKRALGVTATAPESGDGPLFQLATRIPRSLRLRVREVSSEQDRQMQDFVVEALREWLAVQKRRPRGAL